MKKPKASLSHFLKRIKGLFSRKKTPPLIEDEFEEDGHEYFDDEDYEDYEGDDLTDPSLTPLTVTDIRRQQIEDGEAPPELPEFSVDDDEDEEDYYVEEDGPVDRTNPSIREYEINKSASVKERLTDFASSIKAKLSTKQTPSFTMKPKRNPLVDKVQQSFRNINFDEIFETIYSAQTRPTIHKLFLVILITGTTYFGTRALLGYFRPIPTATVQKAAPFLRNSDKSDLRKQIASMKDNDLFGAEDEKPVIISPTKSKEPAICDEAKTKSSLSLKLVNTVVLQDSVKSLASVQVRGKKKEEFLRVGDSVPGMIQIGRITSQKLFFKNLKSRQCEFIEAKKKKGSKIRPTRVIRDPKLAKKVLNESKMTGIKNSGNSFKIKKDVRKKMLENISEVITQARAVQIKNPDGSLCFKMQEIVPGSIYTQLGIDEGDKVCGINGKKISNVAELMNMFGQIDKIDHFELDVNKNGIDQNLEYDFE